MRNKKNDYYEQDKFSAWLKDPKYCGYVNSLITRTLVKYKELGTIFEEEIMKRCMESKKKNDTIAKLEDLLNKIRKAAALRKKKFGGNKYMGESKVGCVQSYCSALDQYIQFLKDPKITHESLSYKSWGVQNWKSALSQFWSDTIKDVAIDGYYSLINSTGMGGSEEAFVKLAIENSYFFDPSLVNEQQKKLHNNICDLLAGRPADRVYARESTDKSIQPPEMKGKDNTNGKKRRYGMFVVPQTQQHIPIWIDSDGNRCVRDLIFDETGFTVSFGYDNYFINFKISHIWGNAYDPRFFTSLWNIVLVPAWANDLLDKQNSTQPLAQKMINTYKAICEQIYDTPNKWGELGIQDIAQRSDNQSTVKKQYKIKIVNKIKDDDLIGRFSSKKFTLK
jgi:hypothetical protein